MSGQTEAWSHRDRESVIVIVCCECVSCRAAARGRGARGPWVGIAGGGGHCSSADD